MGIYGVLCWRSNEIKYHTYACICTVCVLYVYVCRGYRNSSHSTYKMHTHTHDFQGVCGICAHNCYKSQHNTRHDNNTYTHVKCWDRVYKQQHPHHAHTHTSDTVIAVAIDDTHAHTNTNTTSTPIHTPEHTPHTPSTHTTYNTIHTNQLQPYQYVELQVIHSFVTHTTYIAHTSNPNNIHVSKSTYYEIINKICKYVSYIFDRMIIYNVEYMKQHKHMNVSVDYVWDHHNYYSHGGVEWMIDDDTSRVLLAVFKRMNREQYNNKAQTTHIHIHPSDITYPSDKSSHMMEKVLICNKVN